MIRGVEWGSRIAAGIALAGIGLASPDTGSVIKGVFDQLRNPTKIVAGRIAQAIDDPYYWVAPSGTPKYKDTIHHGQWGFSPNNPERIIDTVVQCQGSTQTGNYDTSCVQFQPQESQFPETIQSRDVSMVVLAVRSRNFNGTEVGIVFASVNPDGTRSNTWNGRIVRIGDLSNPTNYSLYTTYSRGLPNSTREYCDPFSDTRVGTNVIEVDVQCSDANGTYTLNLDSQGEVVGDFYKKTTSGLSYHSFIPSAYTGASKTKE